MLNRWSLLALGVGAYLAFTIASFPAGVAYRWFAPPGANFVGLDGTLWRGSAALGSVAGLTLRDVRWRLRPLQLFLARASADVEARLTDGFIGSRVTASFGAVELSDLTASTSLPTLRPVLPVEGMSGLVSASLSRVRLENAWPTAAIGQVRLAQLQAAPFGAAATEERLTLGDYEIDFVEPANEQDIAANFRDTGGPLDVSGTLLLDSSRTYTLDAMIAPRADAQSALVEGLRIMTAEPDADGRRRLTLTGSL